MLEIIEQINQALDSGTPISIYVGIDRFGFVRDGLNYPRGLHGFREWWAIEYCFLFLEKVGLIEWTRTGMINEDTVHITPKPAKRKRVK